jgi:hypothetical protein
MGSRLSDRTRGTDEAQDEAAQTARAADVDVNDPETITGESADATLARLQSTVGNDGMAAAVNGDAPDGVLESFGLPPAPIPDVGPQETDAPLQSTVDGGPPPQQGPVAAGAAQPGPDQSGPAQSGPAQQGPAQPGPAQSGPAQQGPAQQGPQEDTVGQPPVAEDGTGVDQLDDGSLALIDEELVEHERWAHAAEEVGAAASEERADFIATEVGGGVGEGFGTGFGMGLVTTIGIQALELGLEEVAGVAIPGVGQVVGGVMSAYALVAGWDKNMAAIGKMGEGRSGYEEAANDIEGVCAVLDLASNIVNVIAGVVGVVAVAAAAAALLTLGALSPLALAAGAIATAIGVAGMVLGLVKMALQPLVLLFRSLHAFTSQADPREIEAQGHVLEESGKEMGGALGGLAGAAVAGAGHGEPEEATAGDRELPPELDPPEPVPGATELPPPGEPLVIEAEVIEIEIELGGGPIGGEPLEPHPVELPPGEGTLPELEAGPFDNLSDAEIDAALSGMPQREATPADFTDADIDALVSRLDNPGQLETPTFAMAGPVGPDTVNPVTGRVEPEFGLSNMTIEGQNVNPNQIGYHENAYFQGVGDVREIDAFPTGTSPELPPAPGEPPVPETRLRVTDPSPAQGQPRPVLYQETGGNVEVRYHGPNPNAPEGSFSQTNPTVQVNTPNERFPWAGEPVDTEAGQRANISSTAPPGDVPTVGRYRTADGEWLRLPTRDQVAAYEAGQPMPPGVATPEQVASAHYPVYGEPSGTPGGPTGSGGPPGGGGGPEPSVIIDTEALGLEPGDIQTTEAPPRPAARQSDVDWDDPAVRRALGLDPVTGKPTGARLDQPGQLEWDPTKGAFDPDNPTATGPFQGAQGQWKGGEYAPEAYFEVTDQPGYAVRVGPPGAYVDHVFPTLEEAQAYADSLAATGEGQIRDTSALPYGWAPDASGKVWPGNPVDAARVLQVPGGTPLIRSVTAPQPEGSPAWGRPDVLAGGGPQTQLPKGLFPRPPEGGTVSPAQVGEPVPVSSRAENWYTRLQNFPGAETAEGMHEQAEAMERAAALPEAMHTAETAAALYEQAGEKEGHGEGEGGPIVESVNPAYPPPPGTHEDINQMTADLHRLLAARALARQREARAGQVFDAARQQGVRVARARENVGEGLAATQEHQGEIAEHEQANEQSQQQHTESGEKVQDAGSQLAGVATLETLLAGWSGFTGLVLRFDAILPDRAVNAFQKMNNDSNQFMLKLAHVKTGVAEQRGELPTRGAAITQTGERIAATGEQAQGTQATFTQAQQDGAELARINSQHQVFAARDQARAADNAGQADDAAANLQGERQTLAERLAAWAAAHRAAREEAIEETASRMEARGLRITRRPE